jgi:hypothetical protein
MVVPETLTIDRGEAEINSQGRGDNKLAISEYTVYKYFIVPKNIRLIVEGVYWAYAPSLKLTRVIIIHHLFRLSKY